MQLLVQLHHIICVSGKGTLAAPYCCFQHPENAHTMYTPVWKGWERYTPAPTHVPHKHIDIAMHTPSHLQTQHSLLFTYTYI